MLKDFVAAARVPRLRTELRRAPETPTQNPFSERTGRQTVCCPCCLKTFTV